ncbi:MAG: hypothetical protein ACYTEQ_03465 [Planctomycetota bacterium]|jgi:hypothetical protein
MASTGTFDVTSPVFRVSWAGWQSDSVTLQRHGWQIATREDPCYRDLQIIMQQPELGVYAVSSKFVAEKRFMVRELGYGSEVPNLVVQVDLAKEVAFRSVSREHYLSLANIDTIDAEPRYLDLGEFTDVKLSDVWPFWKLPAKRQVIVEPANVQQMLNVILEHQSPKQKELREKIRKEKRREVHAEIISFKAA